MTRLPNRRLVRALLLLSWVGLAAGLPAASQEPPESRRVVVAAVTGVVQPVMAQYVETLLEDAAREGAALVVLELDTPGGLLDSTRQITQAMLASPVPVAVFVAPQGAQAASAGFFLLMAADVAAMAPGTNTGAAHPVQGNGEDVPGVAGEKAAQDAAAQIRALATRHQRAVAAAEAAVLESRSYSAEEARSAGLVEWLAADVPSLLAQLDGVQPPGARTGPLALAGARTVSVRMSAWQRALSALAHPTLAYLLLSLGGLGLYFELANPGSVLPGVLGALFLVLGCFALSVLPVSTAGVALLGLAFVFFLLEIKVVSYGLLSLAGVGSLVLGSLLLFRSADPALQVSLSAIIAISLVALALVAVSTWVLARDRARQVATGVEGMVGDRGIVRQDLAPRGKVFLRGELWDAVAEDAATIPRDREVEVVDVEGLLLRVRAAGPPGRQEV